MTCASCASSLESWLRQKPGVRDVAVNYPNEAVTVSYDPEETNEKELDAAAREIGYGLVTGNIEDRETARVKVSQGRLRELQKKLTVAVLFTLPVFAISMFLYGDWPYQNELMLLLSLPVLAWSGSEFFINAAKQVRYGKTNMDTLVALSTGVAFFFSAFNTLFPGFFQSRGVAAHVYFESAVVIITLILLGRYLEERAKRKTSGAIRQLMNLRPQTVTAVRNGEQVVLPLSDVMVGDLILLRPGEKVPVDGKVKSGESHIDESAITGEYLPVRKTKGDGLYAGTVNQKGTLKMLARKVGSDTLLSRIIQTVQDAQASKPPVQHLVDRIAAVFVPTVMAAAVVAAMVWFFVAEEDALAHAFVILISVLIIACPCALGLATPTAIMVGIGSAAERGLLIKDAAVLERARKLGVVVFDKTGTLTEGRPEVTAFRCADTIEQSLVLNVVRSLEEASEHPLAAAMVAFAKQKEASAMEVENFESHTGKGVNGLIRGQRYQIGKPEWFKDKGLMVDAEWLRLSDDWRDRARTVVMLGDDREVLAVFAIEDAIKPSAKATVEQLTKLGIRVELLSGDNQKTADAVARLAGIEKVKAGVLPSDKGHHIRELREKSIQVAMVGDGINDAEALAIADVGIAMGSGTDVAMESAGVTVMGSDPLKVPMVVALSRATIKTLRQNLFWAFVYNIVAIPIAAGVLYPFTGWLLSPMVAGGAMALSSVSVVLNSLYLKNRIEIK